MIQSIMPYVLFTGECQQAIALYQRLLAAEVVDLLTFGACGFPMTGDNPDWVMNATIRIGEQSLGLADVLQGQSILKTTESQQSIWIEWTDEKKMKEAYEGFAEEGTVITPLGPSLWGSTYGKVQDQFGVIWECNKQLTTS